MNSPAEKLLTLQDCAQILACSVDTVRRILKRTKTKVVRPTKRTVRVRESEFLKLITRSEKATPAKQIEFEGLVSIK